MRLRPRILPPRRKQRGFIIDPFWAGGGGGGSDPSFSSVLVLCHFESTIGGSPPGSGLIFQNSATTGSVTIRNEAGTPWPALDATNPLIGTNSLKYPSGNEWPCRTSVDASLAPGTGVDFTEEWFQYLPNVTTTWMLLDTRYSGGANAYCVYCYTTGVIEFYAFSAVRITSAANALVANTRQHIAVCRAAGTTRLFVDGNQVGSSYTDSNNYSQAEQHTIGAYYNTFQAATLCSFDEWRFTVGVGRYTSNFTPPTAAFPDS